LTRAIGGTTEAEIDTKGDRNKKGTLPLTVLQKGVSKKNAERKLGGARRGWNKEYG